MKNVNECVLLHVCVFSTTLLFTPSPSHRFLPLPLESASTLLLPGVKVWQAAIYHDPDSQSLDYIHVFPFIQ